MTRCRVYLGLGSNLGDRKANLDMALEKLGAVMLNADGSRAEAKVSTYLETEPWGMEGNRFLNAAVRYDMDMPESRDEGGRQAYMETRARELLRECKKIERQMGRTGEPEYDGQGRRIYRNRPIDIDILMFGDLKMTARELTIPHPHMQERDFVMIPLKEVMI